MKDSTPLRLIARLDIKGPNLVKGINFEGLRVLGNPMNFARKYYEAGIDEIFLYDSVASLYGRNSLDQLIRDISNRIYVPLTVSGGIRNLNDIKRVLDSGADKVCINTAAIINPELIDIAVAKYGSSTILASIDYIVDIDGIPKCLIENGRETTNVNLFDWALEVERRGVGELVITSIRNEGMMNGLDISVLKELLSMVKIPVTVHGGIGSSKHILELINVLRVSGISMAGLLHYNYLNSIEVSLEIDGNEGNNSFLLDTGNIKAIFDQGLLEITTINELKSLLKTHGAFVRY